MFASVRIYQVDSTKAAEFNRRVQEDFVPLIRKIHGFVSYHGVDAGDGTWASMSIFETEAAAEESNRAAAAYLSEHIKALVQSGPKVIAGNVAVNGHNEPHASLPTGWMFGDAAPLQ